MLMFGWRDISYFFYFVLFCFFCAVVNSSMMTGA